MIGAAGKGLDVDRAGETEDDPDSVEGGRGKGSRVELFRGEELDLMEFMDDMLGER